MYRLKVTLNSLSISTNVCVCGVCKYLLSVLCYYETDAALHFYLYKYLHVNIYMHAAYLFVKVVGWRRGRLSCSCIIKYKEYMRLANSVFHLSMSISIHKISKIYLEIFFI